MIHMNQIDIEQSMYWTIMISEKLKIKKDNIDEGRDLSKMCYFLVIYLIRWDCFREAIGDWLGYTEWMGLLLLKVIRI